MTDKHRFLFGLQEQGVGDGDQGCEAAVGNSAGEGSS